VELSEVLEGVDLGWWAGAEDWRPGLGLAGLAHGIDGRTELLGVDAQKCLLSQVRGGERVEDQRRGEGSSSGRGRGAIVSSVQVPRLAQVEGKPEGGA